MGIFPFTSWNGLFIRNESEAIEEDSIWPLWPWLPVKRWHRDEDKRLGFIHVSAKATVYLGCLFFVKSGEDLTKLESIEYPSVQQMLSAGWHGD